MEYFGQILLRVGVAIVFGLALILFVANIIVGLTEVARGRTRTWNKMIRLVIKLQWILYFGLALILVGALLGLLG